jgi:hypothetical protein
MLSAVMMALLLPAMAAAQHRHHHAGGALQKDVKMTIHQVSSDAVEIRLGPYNLPANTPHDVMPQAPDFFWDVPFDGWLAAYAPSLLDGEGNDIGAKLLHHVAFYNTGRSDFLCPEKEEHIFGAGGEMNRWPPLPGFGYAVRRGDRIRLSTMFHNPTNTSFPQAYLAVQVSYVTAESVSPGVPQPRGVFPAWFDVMQCGESGYDLRPGDSVKSGQFQMQQSGLLLGLGGHLHDYGQAVAVVNATKKETIATLNAELDPQGIILSMPVVTFISQGGYRLAAGDKVQVSAHYFNSSGKVIAEGAMGIAVGYFLPDDPVAMAAFNHAPRERNTSRR